MITDVGAVAGAVQAIASNAQPIINQQVAQAFQNALTSRIKKSQAVIDLAGTPAFAAAADAHLTGLCNDADILRPRGVQGDPEISLRVADLALFFASLDYLIARNEQLAAK